MKRLLFGIGFVLLVLLVLGFIAEKEYVVERSIEIEAPKNMVYEGYLKTLQHIYSWAPPVENDTTLRIEYMGLPGTVDAQAVWKGRKVEGKEAVRLVLPVQRFETEVRFRRPWESVNQRRLRIEGAGTSCAVTHRFEGHDPFPFNIRHLFVNMDKQLGAKLTQSLLKLKLEAERSYLNRQYNITIDSILPRSVLLLEPVLKGNEPKTESLLIQIQRLDSILRAEGLDSIGPIRKISQMPTVKGQELSGFVLESHGKMKRKSTHQILQMPQTTVLKALHHGSLSSRHETKRKLRQYIQNQGWKDGQGEEEVYLIGAMEVLDTAKWLTEIRIRIEQ